MWRKMLLSVDDPTTYLDLASAARAALFSVDDYGTMPAGHDPFRDPSPDPSLAVPQVAFVTVVVDDQDIPADAVPVFVHAHAPHLNPQVLDNIVYLPDFLDDDWYTDVWTAAEQLHAAEARVSTDTATVADLADIDRLRGLLTPLVELGKDESDRNARGLRTLLAHLRAPAPQSSRLSKIPTQA